jgi:hypothetical protein
MNGHNYEASVENKTSTMSLQTEAVDKTKQDSSGVTFL